MLTPKPLFPGARVALIAPSGPVPAERRQPAYQAVRDLGFTPVPMASCESRYGYLAGTDEVRARDINAAFSDDSIDGVLCMRGGYGANRILPLLDLDGIRAHPKFFSGYSDVTALSIAFNQLCGFVTYHTIMPSTEYCKPVDDYSMRWLRRALFGQLSGRVDNPPDRPMKALVGGVAEGRLTGGNLSLVQQSLGTRWEIDTRGKLLFLEDVGEKPYRIDAYLTSLKNAGKLDGCAGILLGYWTDCQAEEPEKSLTLEQVFRDIIVPIGKPCVMDFCCGHERPTCALPLGGMARLDADKTELTLL